MTPVHGSMFKKPVDTDSKSPGIDSILILLRLNPNIWLHFDANYNDEKSIMYNQRSQTPFSKINLKADYVDFEWN